MTQRKASVLVTCSKLRDLAPFEMKQVLPEDSGRLPRTVSRRRRQQYLCGRHLLRVTLERWTGERAVSHRISELETGKPVCVDGPAVNLSHSGNRVVCAVAGSGDIGIDLEQPRESRSRSKIARAFFSREEADWLDTQPNSRFYMLWVLKEAYSKAVGCGLSGLNRLRCTVLPPAIEATVSDGACRGLGLYSLNQFYLGVAVTQAPLSSLAFEHWEAENQRFLPHGAFQKIAMSDDLAT